MSAPTAPRDLSGVRIDARAGGAVLYVHVSPGARRTALLGVHGDRLKVSVNSPPQDGKANRAVVEFVAGILGARASKLDIVGGASSRDKQIAIAGRTVAAVRAALEVVCGVGRH